MLISKLQGFFFPKPRRKQSHRQWSISLKHSMRKHQPQPRLLILNARIKQLDLNLLFVQVGSKAVRCAGSPIQSIYRCTANPSQPRPKVMSSTTVLQSAGNSTSHWIRHQLSLLSACWNALFIFKLNSALSRAHHLSQRSPHRSLLLSVLPTERTSLTKPLHAAFPAACNPASRQRSPATTLTLADVPFVLITLN